MPSWMVLPVVCCCLVYMLWHCLAAVAVSASRSSACVADPRESAAAPGASGRVYSEVALDGAPHIPQLPLNSKLKHRNWLEKPTGRVPQIHTYSLCGQAAFITVHSRIRLRCTKDNMHTLLRLSRSAHYHQIRSAHPTPSLSPTCIALPCAPHISC
jgi:hypothetical protein